jgi:hypothetical protein
VRVVDLLGDGYHVAHQVAREPDGQGASIASRWPLGALHEVDLQMTPGVAGFAATTLVVEVDAPEPYAPLVFANHVPSWQLQFEYERELQAVAAARFIEDLVGGRKVHVVLAGDFTSDPVPRTCASSPAGSRWTGRAFATATHGRRSTRACAARRSAPRTRCSRTGTGPSSALRRADRRRLGERPLRRRRRSRIRERVLVIL